jgi:hypothetical protein
MLLQLSAGGLISLVNIAVHAVATTVLIASLRRIESIIVMSRPRLELTLIMILAVAMLMLAHCAEVAVWAISYSILGVIPPSANSLYFAFVNYTTLGYGDIVPVEQWRLLGPMTAMNGVLLFGWSTAIIYAVLRNTMVQLKYLPPEQ